MRYIKYALLALLAILLVTVALANASTVTLRLLPEALSGFLGFSWEITLPLFLVVFLGVVVGLLLGYLIEWLREHRYRVAARRERREKERLAAEVASIRRPGPSADHGDDVLALVDAPKTGAVR